MADELTPMFKQFMRIKDMHRDSILFFRMGDFYEMFFEDATIASEILDIALTSRDSSKKTPMCGVPYHAARGYIAKLLRAGKTVAVCEQTEDPKQARGIVKREVVRVITPGTILEPELLDENTNNYLAAISVQDGAIGVAFADVSTGEFMTTQRAGADTNELIIEELLNIEPSEFIFPAAQMDSTLKAMLDKLCPGIPFKPIDDWVFSFPQASSLIQSHYDIHSLTGLGLDDLPLATSAAGAIIHYLKETYRASLQHLKRPAPFVRSEYMIIDSSTARNLELLCTLRDKSKRGSLLGVLDFTVTSLGGRRLRAWLADPLMSLERINLRQETVAECVDSNSLRLRLRDTLREIHDIERLLGRISGPGSNARDMVALKNSLAKSPSLKEALEEASAKRLGEIREAIDPLEDVTSLIADAIVDSPPATMNEGNIIRDAYSPELDKLRSLVRDGKDWLARLQRDEIRRTGINSLKVGYNRVFGYYIEVTKSNLSLVPPEYIRKQTLANSERYYTPELKEHESAILGAEEKMSALESELFRGVNEKVCHQSERIQANAGLVAELDAVQSLAHVAAMNDYCRPELSASFEISIEEGRHPVLEQINIEQPFVPNDIRISEEDALQIITGPNMAGKSTCLRQLGLIVLMAQMGGFVPARSARIGIVDRIFTRVGASDNLVGGESTFMVEMNETANILNNATKRSLIILDEIGRGTSTFDGMSIAWAVAEHIHNSIGAKAMFATHYHELADLANELPRVKNLNVAVREWNSQVVFLYKLVEGSSDHSYGIHVAKLAGLPPEVVARARQVLAELEAMGAQRDSRPGVEPDQLQLFAPPPRSAVEEELKKIDLNHLTPMEALSKLAELRSKIED